MITQEKKIQNENNRSIQTSIRDTELNMCSVVCTLFEGNYHYGVAILANSLYRQGFRGSVYAGYRGPLPKWTSPAKENDSLNWPGARTLKVSEGLDLHFLPLTTDYHLTNYKPDFMISLIKGPEMGSKGIFYFDPDIILVAPWFFMEEWIEGGVAVCEDVNSPLEESHPKRMYWRKYFRNFGQDLTFKNNIYVNGGFVGVSKKNFPFLEDWQRIQENMAPDIGGLDRAIFNKGTKIPEGNLNSFYAFGKTDQDALNATIEKYDKACSYLRKDAMSFAPGLPVLPHAIGRVKPWNKNMFRNWITKGHKPHFVDAMYWENASTPIEVYSPAKVKFKLNQMKLLNLLSRFYKS